MSKVVTAANKATTTVTTDLGKVVKALDTSIKTANSVLENLTKTIEGLDEAIAIKQQELQDANEAVDIKERDNKIEVAFKIRENGDKVLSDLLKERKLANVSLEDHEELVNTIRTLEVGQKDAISKEVAIVVNRLQSEHRAELAALESQHNVESADTKAELNSKIAECDMIRKQLEKQEAMTEKLITSHENIEASRATAAQNSSQNFQQGR